MVYDSRVAHQIHKKFNNIKGLVSRTRATHIHSDQWVTDKVSRKSGAGSAPPPQIRRLANRLKYQALCERSPSQTLRGRAA